MIGCCPFQLPVAAVSVCPTVGLPEGAGIDPERLGAFFEADEVGEPEVAEVVEFATLILTAVVAVLPSAKSARRESLCVPSESVVVSSLPLGSPLNW